MLYINRLRRNIYKIFYREMRESKTKDICVENERKFRVTGSCKVFKAEVRPLRLEVRILRERRYFTETE